MHGDKFNLQINITPRVFKVHFNQSTDLSEYIDLNAFIRISMKCYRVIHMYKIVGG